jgi:hypothetical protein
MPDTTTVATTALAARLAEIADDPTTWPDIYRAEASAGLDGWDGNSPLLPRSMHDEDVREALHTRIAARGSRPSSALPASRDDTLSRLAGMVRYLPDTPPPAELAAVLRQVRDGGQVDDRSAVGSFAVRRSLVDYDGLTELGERVLDILGDAP